MQPETRLFWSTTNAQKLKCTEVIRETFECVSEKKEKYGILKALCLFDIWISMMHSPVRFGTYSNFVNVLMVFYVISGVLAIVLFFELGFRHKVLSFAPAVMVSGTTGMLLRILTAVFIVWVIELILEAIFRNTVPKSSAPKFSKFHGLVEPIEPVHGLNDFTIDYEWDQVWPLVPKKRVIVPFGTRHDGARNAFTIAPVYSYFNFWGLIGREEEREGNWFTRTINLCALPLPIALKWLSKEAWGLKEEKLIKQYLTDFQGPMCFFCCWLQDWPLHYVENPQQASLIFSQIICRDILSMIKLSNKTQRARFAQLCFHQWNGLICCLFLYAIKQNLELRNEPSSALVSFIHRNLKVFGKRSPREIQATWKKRQLHLKELQLASIQKKIEVDEVTSPVDINNKNRSAVQTKSKFPFSIIACLRQAMCRRSNFVLEPATISHNDVLEVVECIEDQMFFEDFDRASLNFGGGSKKATQFPLHKSKGLPSYSVIGEGHSLMSEGQRYGPEHSSRRDRHCLPAKLITKQRDPSVDRDDLLEVKVDGKEEKDLVANFSSMSVADSDSLPGDIDSSDSDILTSVSVDSYYSGPHTNININAASTDDTNEDEEDSPLVMEKTKARREMTETRQDKAAAILASKNPAELQEQTTVGPDVQSTPISHFELVSLGVPFNAATASVVDPDKPHHYLRHRHEIIGYACKSKRCAAYVEIHKKVGHVSLEILKKIIQDLLHFALDNLFQE